MIKSNELRIGNWVKRNIIFGDTESPEFGKITQVYMDGFTVDYHYPAKWYQPIPLTPEILEKCGFVEQFGEFILSNGDPYENGNFLFTIEEDTIQISILNEGSQLQYIFIPKPKHLHQLQNLYYALTGEELTYNAQ